jgi:hypothetical protein
LKASCNLGYFIGLAENKQPLTTQPYTALK